MLWFFSFANDTRAIIVGGQVVYIQTDDISIDEEYLKISMEKIFVAYTFFNHTDKAITTNVAFPLPLSPITTDKNSGWENFFNDAWDEAFHAYAFLAPGTILFDPLRKNLDQGAFTDFNCEIQDKHGLHGAAMTHKIQAITADGKDITEFLRKHDIPISSLYIWRNHWENPEGSVPLEKKLQSLKLISKDHHPLWKTQTTYFWTETFEPQTTTKVKHSYTPHTGSYWLEKKGVVKSINDINIYHRNVLPSGKPEVLKLSDFCGSKKQEKAIVALLNKSNEKQLSAQEVRYILKTGGNWKGPIKNFTLEVAPPDKSCVVLCPFDIQKTWRGTYKITIKDFTPQSDLKVLFAH